MEYFSDEICNLVPKDKLINLAKELLIYEEYNKNPQLIKNILPVEAIIIRNEFIITCPICHERHYHGISNYYTLRRAHCNFNKEYMLIPKK